jgi:2-oxoisovalerate dehydrogenase E1 component
MTGIIHQFDMTKTAPALQFKREKLKDNELLNLYQAILKPRMIEEKMLILLRQNRISKWFSGIGQEAISVGLVQALEKDEYILPMHRNLAIFTGRDIPLAQLFKQWEGKKGGFTKGRDRSFHFGTNEHHIVGMISHLGPQMGVADGIALASKLKKEKKVTVVFTGDGGSSEGDFHESINVAAVWQLPVIFVVENNGYGLSTPSSEQFRFKNFVDKGPGYGIDTALVDGNNLLEVYHAVKKWAADIRKNPRPLLLEAMTFRMRGHEEASGTKYVPKHLFEEWKKKDPLDTFESWLIEEGILTENLKKQYRAEIKKEMDSALEEAFAEPLPQPDVAEETADMYLPFEGSKEEPARNQGAELRLVDAVQQGLFQSMEKYPELVLMGQDIADYGGVFKVTEGFVEKFGRDRVRNTPLCESAIIGTGLGLSIKGLKAMVEMQFADFVTCGFNQIVNNLAKSHYRWGQNADVVVRMPTGAGVAAGPFHSQSNEAWFFHTPGLKIAYPSTPFDAKGLLAMSFEDPNPIIFFEHKALYRSVTSQVPAEYYTIPFGKARIVREGKKASIITYGAAVHWAQKEVEKEGLDVEIIDLRTLLPYDKEAIAESVMKTNRVMVLHEDTITGGIGAEIAAWISEEFFRYLDAPVMRLGSMDTAVPFAPTLEKEFLPQSKIGMKLQELLGY